jgi:uncharacterized repeat protein (TIGR03943 family)
MTKKPFHFRTWLRVRGPALLFFAWVYAGFWLWEENRYQAFLQPAFWFLIAAGTALWALFVLAIMLRDLGKPPSIGRPGQLLPMVLLMLPLVFLWAVYGETLGAKALSMRSMNLGTNEGTPATTWSDPAPTGPPKPATLLMLEQGAAIYAGKNIETEGLVSPGTDLPAGGFLLFRFHMICCAADARPVGVLVITPDGKVPPSDTWVRVRGRFGFRRLGDKVVPCIMADELDILPLPPPGERYLY